MFAGIDQRGHLAGERIDTSYVRALLKIAMVARRSEVIGCIITSVLLSDDMLDLKRD